MNDFSDLYHPYARYGLAYALLEAKRTNEPVAANELPEILAQAIENGLGHFRFKPGQISPDNQTIRFDIIKYAELQRDPGLITGTLSAQGKYLAPTIIGTDGKAGDTYGKAVEIIERLRANKALSSNIKLQRSFAPTAAKLNNGKKGLEDQNGSLFEAACSAITTVTPTKPAAWIEGKPKKEGKKEFYNTTIIPDLPLPQMCEFVELFKVMTTTKLREELMEGKLPPKEIKVDSSSRKRSSKGQKGEQPKPKAEYRRPRIFYGNYPYAPRQQVFGVVGLLAAIGKWGHVAKEVSWARRVLTSIAGDDKKPGVPLYIVNYEAISQVRFAHYVVDLSISGKLSEIIESLTRDTQILSQIENEDSKAKMYSYKLFYLAANRFLRSFNLPSFRDFLATRAEYPAVIQPLFEVYFMQARKIPIEIVQSARALGQWLNRTAYFVAKSETTPDKVQKEKAKILVELESAAASAKTPQDMLHRVMTQAGRLLQQDAPAEATRFMDATMSGEIEPTEAMHLLTAYLRLRATKSEEPKPEETHANAKLYYEDNNDDTQPAS